MGSENTLYGAEGVERLSPRGKWLYFIGICGSGMSGIARLAAARGYAVLGEDRAQQVEGHFANCGIRVTSSFVGYPAGEGIVIYSAAIDAAHPARCAARARGIPEISRSDMLAYLMQEAETRITVAGTHGKSTVTSMLDHILFTAGRGATTLSGAQLMTGDSLRVGSKDIFLAEACEYTDSFLSLSPTVALALNLEYDHPDYFKNMESLERSFLRYLSTARDTVILNAADRRLVRMVTMLTGKRIFTFSTRGEAFLTCREIFVGASGIAAEVFFRGEPVGHIELPLLGEHMLANALAALLGAYAVGVPFSVSLQALASFRAPARRMELRCVINEVAYYDDYAHHPSEVAATLGALRKTTRGRLLALFEAHTYTRAAACRDAFAEALAMADCVVFLPIFSAREAPIEGVDAAFLARALKSEGHVAKDLCDGAEQIKSIARPGDTVVVMGAGDAGKVFLYL